MAEGEDYGSVQVIQITLRTDHDIKCVSAVCCVYVCAVFMSIVLIMLCHIFWQIFYENKVIYQGLVTKAYWLTLTF